MQGANAYHVIDIKVITAIRSGALLENDSERGFLMSIYYTCINSVKP